VEAMEAMEVVAKIVVRAEPRADARQCPILRIAITKMTLAEEQEADLATVPITNLATFESSSSWVTVHTVRKDELRRVYSKW